MTGPDPLIVATEREAARRSATRAKLFDVRRLIGGLFVLYGVMLTVAGLVDGSAERRKAQGIDINLWTGLAMLAVGLAFLLWATLSRDGHELPADAEERAQPEPYPEPYPEEWTPAPQRRARL